MGFFGFGRIQGGVVSGSVLGGRGLFGPIFIADAVPALNPSTFTMGGPNSSGPWNPPGASTFPFGRSNDFGAYSATGATSGGPLYGALVSGGFINGVAIEAVGFDGDPGTGAFVLALGPSATLTQNFFTSLAVGPPLNLILPTATADYFDSNDAVNGFLGYSVWAWAQVPSNIIGTNITVTPT